MNDLSSFQLSPMCREEDSDVSAVFRRSCHTQTIAKSGVRSHEVMTEVEGCHTVHPVSSALSEWRDCL